LRMVNPYLRDSIERVTRDPLRKLGWNDRFIGTMRVGLSQGISPKRYAIGAAAALYNLDPSCLESASEISKLLNSLWSEVTSKKIEKDEVEKYIINASQILLEWRNSGYPNLATFQI